MCIFAIIAVPIAVPTQKKEAPGPQGQELLRLWSPGGWMKAEKCQDSSYEGQTIARKVSKKSLFYRQT